MSEVPATQRCLHAIVHVVATSVVLFVIACVLDLVGTRLSASAKGPLNDVVSLAVVCFVAVTPFVVVLLHFRWQRPSGSNVLQALLTGFVSCVLAALLVITVGLWFHLRIGGGF